MTPADRVQREREAWAKRQADALRRASDYLRQAGPHPLTDAARASLAVGDLALAYAQVRALQAEPLGYMRDACVDYARREIALVWTPELPSRSDARFRAWRDQGPASGSDAGASPPAEPSEATPASSHPHAASTAEHVRSTA